MILAKYKLIAYGVLALGLVAGLSWIIYSVTTAYSERTEYKNKYTKEVADHKKEVELREELIANAEKDREIIIKNEAAEEVIVYVDRIVTKEIVKYRDANPIRCQLPDSWVRIYNRSIDPTYLPASTSETTDKAPAP